MGSLEKRIEALEKLYQGTSTAYEDSEDELEEQQAKMRADLQRAEEKAALEEAQGDTRRRRALDELYKWMGRSEDE